MQSGRGGKRSSNLKMLDKMRKSQKYMPPQKTVFTPRYDIAIKAQQDSQAFSFCAFLLSIKDVMGSLSHTQIKSLLFVFLVASAHAINTQDATKTKQKQNFKSKLFNEVCQQSNLQTYNKPNNMPVGYFNTWELEPASCGKASINWIDCLADKAALAEYKPNVELIQAMRNEGRMLVTQWKNKIDNQLGQFIHTLTHTERNILFPILGKIKFLKSTQIIADYAAKYHGGNCGEHTSTALFDVLREKLNHGLDARIQHVLLSSLDSKVETHEFLFLDSNMDEIKISNDPAAVQVAFNQLETTICDKWNSYYGKFQPELNGVYTHTAYDSLFVTSISLEFAGFKQLSRKAQQLICDELSGMDLNVDKISDCHRLKKR